MLWKCCTQYVSKFGKHSSGSVQFSSVVSINDDGACDVVLNMGDVTDAKRAQVEDIVKRKTNIAGEKIVITPIVVEQEAE